MKKVFLLVLLVNVAFCVPIEFNLTEQGCENVGGVWTCHLPAETTGLAVKFVGDIACFSNVSTEIGSCFSAVELQKTVNVDDCTYSIGADRETTYNDCQKVAINKGTVMLAFIDSEQIGVFDCKNFQEETIYVTQCSANSTVGTMDGLVSLGGEEDTVLIVTSMSPKLFSLTGFVMDNLIYIVLVALIIIVAYWVFAPHTPMLKEKKVVKKETTHKEETPTTKREMRYGRRL